MGVRLYVSQAEAAELARGVCPNTVAEKAKNKLKPALPMRGQTDLISALAELEAEGVPR